MIPSLSNFDTKWFDAKCQSTRWFPYFWMGVNNGVGDKKLPLLWGYAHASPQNCLFWGPGFGTSFCSILRLLYCILGWQSSLQASFHWKMQSVKLPVCPTPVGCICSNGRVTLEQFAQRADETGEQSFAIGDSLRIVATMLASPVPLLSNVDLQGRKQSIQGFLFLRAFSTLTSWGQRGARQKPTEFAMEKRERKTPQPKARTESEEEAGRESYGQGTLPSWTKTTDS